MSVRYDTNPANYQICSQIGQCTTNIGIVYLARHLPTKTLVGVKKFNLEKITREDIEAVQDEIIMMKQLSHPNLLPCLTSFVSGHDIVSVLPLMGYGSCHDIMARHFHSGLPEQAIACILKAVLQALQYLHSKGIIHRAVRASHILVGSDGSIRLTGLRYSCLLVVSGRWRRKVHSFPPSTLPNLNWLSPELLQQNQEGYNEKCDVYSVGVVACELANGVVPFWDTPLTLMLTEKVKGAAPQLIDQSTFIPPLPQGGQGEDWNEDYLRSVSERRFSHGFHCLAEACMAREGSERPSPTALLTSSPFLRSAPPPASLPSLLLPAAPITQSSVLEVQDDLDTMIAAEKMTNLELETVSWDF